MNSMDVAMLQTGKQPKANVRNAALACLTIFAGEKSTRSGQTVHLRDFVDDDLHESLLGSL